MPAAAKTVDGDRVRDRGHSGTIAGRILIVTALATVTFEGRGGRFSRQSANWSADWSNQLSQSSNQSLLFYFLHPVSKKNTPLSVAAASKPVFAMVTAVRRCLFRRRRLEFGHRQTSLPLLVGWLWVYKLRVNLRWWLPTWLLHVALLLLLLHARQNTTKRLQNGFFLLLSEVLLCFFFFYFSFDFTRNNKIGKLHTWL